MTNSLMPLFRRENFVHALHSTDADLRTTALEKLIHSGEDVMPVLREVFEDAVTRWTLLGDLRIINPKLAETLENGHANDWVSVTSSGIQAAAK